MNAFTSQTRIRLAEEARYDAQDAEIQRRRDIALPAAEKAVEKLRPTLCPIYFARNREKYIRSWAEKMAQTSYSKGESFEAFKARMTLETNPPVGETAREALRQIAEAA